MKFKQQTLDFINNQQAFDKLSQYVSMIENANQKFNLTGFKGDKLWEEGIYESILCLNHFIPNKSIKLLDVGAGAGFPSIPFKIINSQIHLFIYESIQKRVQFLQEVSDTLRLDSHIFKIRAEESTAREVFDFITARAVAPLRVLLEITSHLGKIGAQYIFIKGPKYEAEMIESKTIIKKLKIKIHIKKIVLPNKILVLITYTKTFPTPSYYPRLWKDIKNDKNH